MTQAFNTSHLKESNSSQSPVGFKECTRQMEKMKSIKKKTKNKEKEKKKWKRKERERGRTGEEENGVLDFRYGLAVW